jgi:hypothetical protein
MSSERPTGYVGMRNPDHSVGAVQGGFSDYIAYVFAERRLVVLESVRKGNAIYVFGQNWDRFSKLSKAEILDRNCSDPRRSSS